MVKYTISNRNITSDDDSSIFHAKIMEEDLKLEEALQNIRDKFDELTRGQLLKEALGLVGAQNVEKEISKETHEEFASLLDEVRLFAEERDTLSTFEELLQRI